MKKEGEIFKGRHFSALVILQCLRWYLKYSLSYRDLEEMMKERGVNLDHTTIFRWIMAYAAEFSKRLRSHLRPTSGSWRVVETYVKIKGVWKYLYRAVDSYGNTIDFLLRARRDKQAAKRFFQKALKRLHNNMPHSITTDKNKAYPPVLEELKEEGKLSQNLVVRSVKYLNNIIEQDHRRIKRLTKPGLGFHTFRTAVKTLAGYESMAMLRKGQVQGVAKNDFKKQADFFNTLFGVAV